MDDPYISRAEHEEFSRRLAEENKRQDKRIEMLEENVREMRALTNSVERLATSVEDMVKEQEKDGTVKCGARSWATSSPPLSAS